MTDNISTIWIELINKNSKNVLCCGIYREWNRVDPREDAQIIMNQIQKANDENGIF